MKLVSVRSKEGKRTCIRIAVNSIDNGTDEDIPPWLRPGHVWKASADIDAESKHWTSLMKAVMDGLAGRSVTIESLEGDVLLLSCDRPARALVSLRRIFAKTKSVLHVTVGMKPVTRRR